MGLHENRKSKRFSGSIPVMLNQGTGLTRDYSADGVYFLTDQAISLGERIELVMLLDHQSMGTGVRLRCWGDVVRVENNEDRTGVAIAISKHLFELAPKMAEAYMDTVMSLDNDGRLPS
ncbi:MAG TPA: PilZ domain-containing protein [Geobacteraceae bacterium]|nr:PilZ domain-containing protein [Geobacteraceae bacterium]